MSFAYAVRVRNRAFAIVLVSLSVLTAGCLEATQIVIVSDTDLRAEDVDTFRLLIESGGTRVTEREFDLGVVALPVHFTVVPSGSKSAPVEVTLQGLRNGTPFVSQRVETNFVPCESKRLELFLRFACVDCGDSCPSTCAPISVPGEQLPTWTGPVPGLSPRMGDAGFDVPASDIPTDQPLDSPIDSPIDSPLVDGGGFPGLDCEAASTAVGPLANPGVDLCQGAVQEMDLPLVVFEIVAPPGVGEVFDDTSFGTQITRVTRNFDAGTAMRPPGRHVTAWNADESLLMVRQTGSGNHALYNGTTYERIGDLPVGPTSDTTTFWDPRFPDRFYYFVGRTMRVHYPCSGEDELIRDFTECGAAELESLTGLSTLNTVAVACGPDLFVYDLDDDTLATTARIVPGEVPQIAPNGEHVFAGGFVYPADLSASRIAGFFDDGNAAVLQHAAGTSVFAVQFNGFPIGTLVGRRLDTDAATPLIVYAESEEGPFIWPYPPAGSRPTASSRLLAWMATGQGISVTGEALHGEIALANADTKRVCRVAYHRNTQDRDEPHLNVAPSMSPSGTRIAFSSNWNVGNTADVYILELPAHSR